MNQDDFGDMDFENDDNFGSRFGREDDFEEEEEADPFDGMFEDDDEIHHKDEDEVDNVPAKRGGMQHRGTFVGTALYASPEMLSNSVSGPFGDMWALGVIVFELLTGEVPWKGREEFIIF